MYEYEYGVRIRVQGCHSWTRIVCGHMHAWMDMRTFFFYFWEFFRIISLGIPNCKATNNACQNRCWRTTTVLSVGSGHDFHGNSCDYNTLLKCPVIYLWIVRALTKKIEISFVYSIGMLCLLMCHHFSHLLDQNNLFFSIHVRETQPRGFGTN